MPSQPTGDVQSLEILGMARDIGKELMRERVGRQRYLIGAGAHRGEPQPTSDRFTEYSN